jgi:hypothetical protein
MSVGKTDFSIAVRPFNWSDYYPGSVIHFVFRNTKKDYLFGFDLRRYPSNNQNIGSGDKFCLGGYNSGSCWDENFLISKGNWIIVKLSVDFDDRSFVANASGIDGTMIQTPKIDITNSPYVLHDLMVDTWYGMSADFDNILVN